MSSQTDTLEGTTINSILTILPGSEGPGNLEVSGTIYANQIFQNTDNTGVNLENILLKEKTIQLSDINTNSLVNPPSNKILLFVDLNDTKLKSIDSNGILTSYQPLTTKGDILSHNGTTQIRIPAGINGQVLSINNSTDSGLEWVDTTETGNSGTSKNNIFLFYLNSTDSTLLFNNSYGAYISSVTPNIENGASLNYFFTKSNITGSSNIVKLNTNNSIISNTNFNELWNNYKGITISKNYNEGNGTYEFFLNTNYTKNVFTLTGTTPVSLSNPLNSTVGIFFISINYRISGGPCGNYILIKNNSASNTFLLNTINSSPGTGGNTFNFTWNSGQGISINKTISGNNNGEYTFVNNFENTNITSSIILTGTSTVNIPDFYYYDKKSCFLKVEPISITGAPIALFFISKNLNTRSGNITRISAPGIISATNLNLSWGSNSSLSISKSNGNYNGTYKITFSH